MSHTLGGRALEAPRERAAALGGCGRATPARGRRRRRVGACGSGCGALGAHSGSARPPPRRAPRRSRRRTFRSRARSCRGGPRQIRVVQVMERIERRHACSPIFGQAGDELARAALDSLFASVRLDMGLLMSVAALSARQSRPPAADRSRSAVARPAAHRADSARDLAQFRIVELDGQKKREGCWKCWTFRLATWRAPLEIDAPLGAPRLFEQASRSERNCQVLQWAVDHGHGSRVRL